MDFYAHIHINHEYPSTEVNSTESHLQRRRFLVIHTRTHIYTPLGLAGACHCSWMMSSRSPKRLQRGGATPHGLSSLVVTVVMSLEPRPKLFQPLTLYS